MIGQGAMQIVAERKVRDFFTLKTYSGVYTLEHLAPETIIKSYIYTPDSKETMSTILRELKKAPGTDRKPCIVSGDRGMGKSHTMRVLREVLKTPALISLIEDPFLRREMAALAGKKFLVVDINCLPLTDDSLKAMFYQAFEAALREYGAPELPPIENWLDLEDSDDQLRFIRDFIPSGFELAIFLDDIAEKLIAYKNATRIIGDIEFLLTLALSTGIYPIFLVAAFFEHLLTPPDFTTRYKDIHAKIVEYRLTTAFLIRRISKAHLIDLISGHILVKSVQQKLELEKLHHYFKETVPFFSTSMDQFVELYPIHPSVFHISFFLHRYIRNFSLLSFVYSTANRLLGYRCTAMATPDTIFDLLYHEAKKVPDLRIAVESYETINQQVISSLPMSDKIPARMLLKAVFLFSITEEFKPTPETLICSLLLSDFQGKPVTRESVVQMLEKFEEQAPQCIRKSVTTEGDEYHLVNIEHASIDFIINEIRSQEAGFEDRLQRALFASFFKRVPEIAVAKEQMAQPIHDDALKVSWRGTSHRGVLSWTPKALNVLVGSKTLRDYPQFRDFVSPEANLAELRGRDVSMGKTPDWQISVFSLVNDPISAEAVSELAHRYPTHMMWVPGPLGNDEREKLEMAAILLSDDYRVKFFDIQDEYQRRREAAEAEIHKLFTDKYLREGSLLILGKSTPVEALAGEAGGFMSVIGSAARDCLDRVFPEHPVFPLEIPEDLDPSDCINFILSGATQDPAKGRAVGQLLQSLSLAVPSEDRWVVDPLNEKFGDSPAVADFLALVSGHPAEPVPLNAVYDVFADSPLGLEKPVVDHIFLALVSAGRIKLFDRERPESHILHRNSLTPETDLAFYDAVQAMAEESLPLPELLRWGYVLCKAQMETGNLSQNRRLLKSLLAEWMDFQQANPLEKSILDLPIELQTTFLWKELQSTRRSAAAIQACVTKVLEQQCSLEDGLMQMAQTFSNSLPAFETILEEIENVGEFMGWAKTFVKAKNYVMASEKTGDPHVENLRCELFTHFERPSRLLQKDRREHFQTVFENFRKGYSAYYVAQHDAQRGALQTGGALDQLLKSGWWANLPVLAKLDFVERFSPRVLNLLLDRLTERECRLNVSRELEAMPCCDCGFHLGSSNNVDALARRIVEQAERYRQSQLEFLSNFKKIIIRELQKVPSIDDETARQVVSLVNGNLDSPVSFNAVKLINFIMRRKPVSFRALPKHREASGRVYRKDTLEPHLVELLKRVQETRDNVFLLLEDGEETSPSNTSTTSTFTQPIQVPPLPDA